MKVGVILIVSLSFAVLTSSHHHESEPSEQQSNTVQRLQGLENSKAYVGFLFSYKIPQEAFTGEISEYKVSETCEDTLPSWLTFDGNNRTFRGVPQAADVGLVYICVKAVAWNSTTDSIPPPTAKDVFSIEVVVGLTPSFSCPEAEFVTLANVLADVTLSELQQPELLRILQSVGTVLHISENAVRLTPLHKRYNHTKNPVLFSGTGDNLERTKQGARIQFQIGCSGDQITNENRLVNYLERNSSTGEFSRAVGYPVFEWEVLTGFPAGNDSSRPAEESCRFPEGNLPDGLQYSASIPTINTFVTTDSNASDASRLTNTQEANFAPVIFKRLKRLALVSGKVWIYKIPEDTFKDFEDGSTRDLQLKFENDGQTDRWIHFDSETQTLSALPLESHLGLHTFSLKATDSNGASITEQVTIAVIRDKRVRRINHEFIMTRDDSCNQHHPDVVWQIDVLKRLSEAIGHTDTSSILVKSFSYNPVQIIWVDYRLQLEYCPVEEINKIYSELASEDGTPKERIQQLMLPEFQIQKIEMKFIGNCHSTVSPQEPSNFLPILRNPIDMIQVDVGDVLKFKIPNDVFYDFEDGSTRNLHLALHNEDRSELPESSWVQFDSVNQEIYGIAGEEHVGRHIFVLEATDSNGASDYDQFVLQVAMTSKWTNFPVKFSISFEENVKESGTSISRKILAAEKISNLYGDDSLGHLMILPVTESPAVFSWSNTSLTLQLCPVDEIRELSKFLVSDNCSPSTDLVREMEPEFTVTKVNITLTSGCAANEQEIQLDCTD